MKSTVSITQTPKRHQHIPPTRISTRNPPTSEHTLDHIDTQSPPPRILTFNQFAELEPAFPISRLRALRFYSGMRQTSKGPIAGNGYEGAFCTVGKSVYVDVAEFWRCVARENGRDVAGGWCK